MIRPRRGSGRRGLHRTVSRRPGLCFFLFLSITIKNKPGFGFKRRLFITRPLIVFGGGGIITRAQFLATRQPRQTTEPRESFITVQ